MIFQDVLHYYLVRSRDENLSEYACCLYFVIKIVFYLIFIMIDFNEEDVSMDQNSFELSFLSDLSFKYCQNL